MPNRLTIVGFRSSLRRRVPERPVLRAFAAPFSSGSFSALVPGLGSGPPGA